MLTKLAGGRIIDPLNHLNGEIATSGSRAVGSSPRPSAGGTRTRWSTSPAGS
jgi:hypothetical protein